MDSARAPSVRTRLRLASYESVPTASGPISTSPIQTLAGTRTLQRAFVEHVTARVAPLVEQVDLAFEVLTGVGVRQAVEVRLGTGAGELDTRVDAHHAATEADDEVAQGGVAVDAGLMGCRMHGVVAHCWTETSGEVRAVADDDLDVLRELRGPSWRRTIVACEFGIASMTRCACARPPSPWIAMTAGSSSSTLAGMRSRCASVSRLHAIAAGRSSGVVDLAARRDSDSEEYALQERPGQGDPDRAFLARLVAQHLADAIHRRVLPVDLATGRSLEVGRIVGARPLQTVLNSAPGAVGVRGGAWHRGRCLRSGRPCRRPILPCPSR